MVTKVWVTKAWVTNVCSKRVGNKSVGKESTEIKLMSQECMVPYDMDTIISETECVQEYVSFRFINTCMFVMSNQDLPKHAGAWDFTNMYH